MITWLLSGLIVGLVVLYIMNPPQRKLDLSAARFFGDLAPPNMAPLRLSLRRLISTPLFWLQLLVLLLLLVTIFEWQTTLASDRSQRKISLLLAIDTSASMSTKQAGVPRLETAKLKALEALTKSHASTHGGVWCVRLARFDLEWRELAVYSDPAAAAALLELAPRAIGTDLEQVRRALLAAYTTPLQECPTTHIVVISDRPEPTWLADIPLPVTWIDIGQVVSNVGFTTIIPVRNELTGNVEKISFQINAFGPQPAASTVIIKGPDGFINEQKHVWGETVVWEYSFAPGSPGTYTLSLQPDGVYSYDDTATIEIRAAEQMKVDWHLLDRGLLEKLKWQQTSTSPQVRIIAAEDLAELSVSDVPLLVVGSGYSPTGQRRPVGDFDEASPLLGDLNLDVAEEVGIQGIDNLPPNFAPVLTGKDGSIWIAAQTKPVIAVYVPGLPTLTDDDTGSFSQTIFFNALRELLGKRQFPDLYTLTSVDNETTLQPEGNRLALHPDEGSTGGEPRSAGSLDVWLATPVGSDLDRMWPLILVAAMAALILERSAALLGGGRWI